MGYRFKPGSESGKILNLGSIFMVIVSLRLQYLYGFSDVPPVAASYHLIVPPPKAGETTRSLTCDWAIAVAVANSIMNRRIYRFILLV
jgi:hypothetical protein